MARLRSITSEFCHSIDLSLSLTAMYHRAVQINISTNVQKEPWFIKLNPNGRIPTLVDRSRDNFVVFETAAILLYLQQWYDKDNKFGFDKEKEANDYSEALQWIFFAVSIPTSSP